MLLYTASDIPYSEKLIWFKCICVFLWYFWKILICIYVSTVYLSVTGAFIKIPYNRKVQNEDLRKCQGFWNESLENSQVHRSRLDGRQQHSTGSMVPLPSPISYCQQKLDLQIAKMGHNNLEISMKFLIIYFIKVTCFQDAQ